MTVNQYIHELNNTEIGNTNTNETYVSVPRALAPSIAFLPEGDVSVIYKRNGLAFPIKFQAYGNGEFRITKLGPLYRICQICAGDMIQIEECDGNLYVDFIQRKNLVVFACKKNSVFECLNEDRVQGVLNKDIVCMYNGINTRLKVVKGESFQPRVDSARQITSYGLFIDESELVSKKDTLFNLFLLGDKAVMSEARRDVICKIEWSDYE